MVGEVGLEPTKPLAADLQSAPFAARDTPPLSMPKLAPKPWITFDYRPHSPLVTPKTGGQRHVGTPAKRDRSGGYCGGRILVNYIRVSIEIDGRLLVSPGSLSDAPLFRQNLPFPADFHSRHSEEEVQMKRQPSCGFIFWPFCPIRRHAPTPLPPCAASRP